MAATGDSYARSHSREVRSRTSGCGFVATQPDACLWTARDASDWSRFAGDRDRPSSDPASPCSSVLTPSSATIASGWPCSSPRPCFSPAPCPSSGPWADPSARAGNPVGRLSVDRERAERRHPVMPPALRVWWSGRRARPGFLAVPSRPAPEAGLSVSAGLLDSTRRICGGHPAGSHRPTGTPRERGSRGAADLAASLIGLGMRRSTGWLRLLRWSGRDGPSRRFTGSPGTGAGSSSARSQYEPHL